LESGNSRLDREPLQSHATPSPVQALEPLEIRSRTLDVPGPDCSPSRQAPTVGAALRPDLRVAPGTLAGRGQIAAGERRICLPQGYKRLVRHRVGALHGGRELGRQVVDRDSAERTNLQDAGEGRAVGDWIRFLRGRRLELCQGPIPLAAPKRTGRRVVHEGEATFA